ncbi:hypothetical protein ACIGNX_22350 [Actinosynnema sp. NPDC053489]|uniref:hypothetical protein n=1 Tax=Actinosynnema sp. NPDC053489 TaxID=3363916 RepID=UPI0037C659FB
MHANRSRITGQAAGHLRAEVRRDVPAAAPAAPAEEPVDLWRMSDNGVIDVPFPVPDVA